MEHYNPDNNENEVLYQRFKNALGQGADKGYFDEDDIVVIFDTAGDFNDEYVRMEALLYAARYYPDSVAMADRRAIFYNSYSDTMRDDFLVDHPELVTFITSLLRLLSINPDTAQAIEHLDNLVAGVEELDDEEIIQLVDTAAALGLIDWLADNIELLKSKTSYQPTLLYEMDIVFENAKRYDLCVRVLEEVTTLEPFIGEFWRLLAQTYLEMENFGQALSAIEYALAIDPADDVAKIVKAEILYRTADRSKLDEAIALLEPLLEKDPSREDIYRPLALCYLTGEYNDKIGKMLDILQPLFPGDEWTAGSFIHLNPQKARVAIDAYAASGGHTEEDWIKLALFVGEALPSEGADVLIAASDKIELTTGWETLMQLLYNAKRYSTLCDIVKHADADSSLRPNFTHEMSMLFVKALIATGEIENAVEYARSWCESFGKRAAGENPAIAVRLESITLFMKNVIVTKSL